MNIKTYRLVLLTKARIIKIPLNYCCEHRIYVLIWDLKSAL